MPRLRSLLRSAVAAIALAAAAPAAAGDYVIAVPGTLDRDHARQIHADVLGFALETATPGDTLRIVDASAIETIAVFRIPDDSRARIPALRQRALADPIAAWNRFVRQAYIDAPQPAPGNEAAILLPQLLTHLASQAYAHIPPDQRAVCLLVAGSARYRDPREPAFDMTAARFPSDGLILASQTASPYGTADRQGLLRGVFLHFLALDTHWASDLYRLRVQRAWQLFIEAQGGDMPTFTDDPETAIDRFADCERKPARRFHWDSTRNTAAMITAERAALIETAPQRETPQETVNQQPDETPPPAPPADTPPTAAARAPGVELSNDDWLRNDTVAVSSTAPGIERANLKLGIRWGDSDACGNVDLDLYVRSDPARPYLYYRNVASPDGRYHKDHRSAPDVRNGLEYVDITDQVPLDGLDILVNHYAGTCPGGPRGLVRAYVNGTAYELPFHIPAEDGNGGSLPGRPQDDPHWVRIAPDRLFNIP